MALTPVDIIKKHIDSILDAKWLPDGAPTSTELAAVLDKELRDNFTMIANAEIDAVEVRPTGFDGGWRKAGTGPEQVIATKEANPNWLRNQAVNALAMARDFEKGQGIRLPDNSRGKAFASSQAVLGTVHDIPMTDEEVKRAMDDARRMPVMVTPTFKDDNIEISIRVTGNPMLFYMGTDKQPYRLDDGFPPGSRGFPTGREAQIALALTDLSASKLHEVTK